MMLTLYCIEPLTGANYSMWKLKLHWVLIKQELWGHVTRNMAWPVLADVNVVTAAEQQSIDDWEWRDQQAYVAICLRISDEYIVYTYNTTTATKVWDTLMTIFEANGLISIINTWQEFFHTFAQEGKNMKEHIRKLHGLQQMLHMMGELISDWDFSHT